MKNKTKIAIAITIILILAFSIILIYKGNSKKSNLCGTPFNIRNSEGQCEIYVGCELPEGVVEDKACEEILKRQIDG